MVCYNPCIGRWRQEDSLELDREHSMQSVSSSGLDTSAQMYTHKGILVTY